MESLLLYLLKASAFLVIFYLAFLLLLKKETFFELNRKFLIGGLICSAILPAIYFTRTIYIEPEPINASYIQNGTINTNIVQQGFIDWWQIAGIIYLIIIGFFLIRFIIQLASTFQIIFTEKAIKENGINYIETSEDQLPFSFFNYVVYNPLKHDKKDLELILQHEKIHACQYHSADIILANLFQCILWFNPISLLYKKAIEQNLEFIADRQVVEEHNKLKEYQHALVKVSVANLKPALTNHFYQSFIKKRILMLNKKSSTNSPAWKLGIIAPFIFGFLLFFNVKTEAQVKEVEKTETQTIPEKSIELIISKNTTREELNNYKQLLEENEIKARFRNLKFSNGLLTSINFSFEDLETGNKGSMKKENENGIKAFRFFRSENNSIGVADVDSEEMHFKIKPVKETKVVFIEKDSVNGDLINWKSDEKAYQYVIEGPNSSKVYRWNYADKSKILESKKDQRIYIVNVEEDSVESSAKAKVRVISKTSNQKPMYVIDGNVVEDIEKNNIEPSEISHINVFKGDKAQKKYGKKAVGGVVEIFTKNDSFDSKDEKIVKISPEMTDSELKEVKQKIKKLANIDMEINNISRNKGLITAISISCEKDGKEISNANFNDSKSIPVIYVGARDGKPFISSASK